MTSANSLLPILRRLDEIERKLDRVLQELQTLNTPAAIGYSVRRGNLPRKELDDPEAKGPPSTPNRPSLMSECPHERFEMSPHR